MSEICYYYNLPVRLGSPGSGPLTRASRACKHVGIGSACRRINGTNRCIIREEHLKIFRFCECTLICVQGEARVLTHFTKAVAELRRRSTLPPRPSNRATLVRDDRFTWDGDPAIHRNWDKEFQL